MCSPILRSYSLIVLLTPLAICAQDTIHVQTLSFSDITARRGTYLFPDTTHTFRKVLMHHTLKCDPQTTQDQYNCGEWDYLTYNIVHEHTGVYDSTAQTHPYFKVGATQPPSVERASTAHFNTRQVSLPLRMVTSILSETDHQVGNGNTWDPGILQAATGTNRSQYLFLASELLAAGLQAGAIHQLRATTDGLGDGAFDRFTVRLKHTTATTITAFDEVGLTTVHDAPATDIGQTAGVHSFMFTDPFTWNGTSNILVDLAAERVPGSADASFLATDVAAGVGIVASGSDGYLQTDNDFIALDTSPLSSLGTSITIMFRAKGDTTLPLNTTVLEAVNAQNQRMLNVHLPWSNGRVYWDAGNDGSGYDRIDKAATTANVEGQWNHWAFVKNTATGSMKIYLNGTLWHSGTGMTRPMAGITAFRFASAFNGDVPYPGMLDEINVFAAELNAATINAWKNRAIDATHPNAANLLYSFHCDEAPDEHFLVNSADPAHGAWPMGTVRRKYRSAAEVFHTALPATARPNLTFVQGDYTSSLDTLIMDRTEALPLLTEEHFTVNGNVVVPIDTVFAWSGGMTYTFDPSGTAIDSIPAVDVTDINDTLDYYAAPFELLNDWEIGRYITPYGIGLSLGAQGFRWTFDVTDYQWMLHDSVDLSAGNQQELIDLEFEMIEGVPPRPVVAHQRPWGGLTSRSYADLSGDVAFPPIQVQLSPDAAQWSLRTRLTGHGHNSNTGAYPHCCEWKDNTHYVRVNGTQVDAWHIWQENDCALNPVYPQGGTWLGSREGWCPGDRVKDHEVALPGLTAGGTATLDYAITPVPSSNLGMGGGNYVVNMDLMEFGPASHLLDAEIVEVKRPSKTDMWRRDNPICRAPIVVLRNAGSQSITSVTFTYHVSGGTPLTHTWTGQLDHMERVDVELPVNDDAFWVGDADHKFLVSVSAPNGGVDQYADNDNYLTTFTLPIIYNHDIVVHYKTNNRPSETSVRVLDIDGTVLLSRAVHTANTEYIDTLHLSPGCYTFEMIDAGNDGLSYWADPDAGQGFARLKKPNGVPVMYFPNEFGRAIHFAFTISATVGLAEPTAPVTLEAQPNPTNGSLLVLVSGLLGDADLDLLDMNGRSVMYDRVALRGNDRVPMDLDLLPSGLYVLRIRTDAEQRFLRVVKD